MKRRCDGLPYNQLTRCLIRLRGSRLCDWRRAESRQISENSSLVGCLTVCENGTVVGEEIYRVEDLKYAETIALKAADAKAHNSIVCVALEPHAHFS